MHCMYYISYLIQFVRGRGRPIRSAVSSGTSARWHTSEEPDITPPVIVFRPARTPGPQMIPVESYSALELFQQFFSPLVCQTIAQNSNAYAAKNQDTARKPWQDMSVKDFFSYLSLVIYMGLVKVPGAKDYWNGSRLYTLGFPASVMSGRKFQAISSALHLSDPKEDAENMRKKGTPAYDRLGKLKPVYQQIRTACKTFFHPHQDIAVDERMVASKARIGLKQFMKDKPTKWGYKLFVLADSKYGYTWDFFIYEGKSPVAQAEQTKGLSYESVMALVDKRTLGTGYKLYVDNFYTSPLLFRDLLQKGIWACGTIRSNRVGFPQATDNRLPRNAPRGSIRWIRDDKLLFVEWKDTREVLMCSSFHSANGDCKVQRRIKTGAGEWMVQNIPIPTAVVDYNKNMGGVDLSDALIGYYSVLKKTRKWYRALFYHFVDIAVVNAFIIHQQMALVRKQKPKTQREFREALVLEQADWNDPSGPDPVPTAPPGHQCHRPKFITETSDDSRRRCRVCHQKTLVICQAFNAHLCFQATRDCFNPWHEEHNL
nr:piggyBac transposable element-derived protein 4-like [Misgurnus anguillicaudatus]